MQTIKEFLKLVNKVLTKHFYLRLLFLFLPLTEIVLFQFMYFLDKTNTLNWFKTENFWIIIFTYFIILAFQLLVYSLINNLYVSILISFFVFLLLNIINFYKIQILNQPIYPWDLFLTAQVVDLIPQLTKIINFKYIFLFTIIIAALFAIYKLVPKCKLNIIQRIALFFLTSIVLISFVFNDKGPIAFVFDKLSVSNSLSTPKTNVTKNGLLLSFFLYIPDTFIDKPKNYSKELIERIVKDMEYEKDTEKESTNHPNIVVIMSESLFDITKIESLEFNQDPIPNIKKYKTGSILSPQYGGGTANVEFEALTGMSNVFLPDGSSPYQQYIKKETPSLASVLTEKGYRSIAMHTYYGWYWNRENVYKYLGFQDFISLENIKNPETKGQYTSDKTITDQIISEIDNTSDPMFIYAITMQNHTPYVDGQYGENKIKLTNNLSKETKGMLETYSSGISDSDLELIRLINHYKDSNEPTVIAFFGDHLPSLGSEYSSYVETDYISSTSEENMTLDEKVKLKQTPFILWSNYDGSSHINSNISSSFLPPLILEKANIELPTYYQFLKDFSSKLPGYTKTVKITEKNSYSEKTPKKYKDIEEIYKLLQYDLLFGDQYSVDLLFGKH